MPSLIDTLFVYIIAWGFARLSIEATSTRASIIWGIGALLLFITASSMLYTIGIMLYDITQRVTG